MSDYVQNCHVDYLSFTVKPFSDAFSICNEYVSVRVSDKLNDGEVIESGVMSFDYVAFIKDFIYRIFGPVSLNDPGKGILHYSHRFDIPGIGLVAWGGNYDTILFQFSGEGCARIANWNWLADALDDMEAVLTRCDLAHDDYDGETVSVKWAVDQYEKSGFKPSRGISPDSQLLDDMGSGKGKTFYVGSRLSGKLCRIYEKGRQLGDKASNWCRFEVEFRKGHRDLTPDMLRDPTAYLAGSYPCASFLGSRHCQVKTRAFTVVATIQKATEHAKKQAGGLICALLKLGNSAQDIISMLVKPAVSPRLVGAVHDLETRAGRVVPEVLNPAWWKEPSQKDIERIENSLSADLAYWRNKWSGCQFA